MLAGAPPGAPAGERDIRAALVARLADGTDRKTAVAEVATALGVPKRHVYALSLELPR